MKKLLFLAMIITASQAYSAEVKLSITGMNKFLASRALIELKTNDSKGTWILSCEDGLFSQIYKKEDKEVTFQLNTMCGNIQLCAIHDLESEKEKIDLVLDTKTGLVKRLSLPGVCL